jgi:hypothetical protein
MVRRKVPNKGLSAGVWVNGRLVPGLTIAQSHVIAQQIVMTQIIANALMEVAEMERIREERYRAQRAIEAYDRAMGVLGR